MSNNHIWGEARTALYTCWSDDDLDAAEEVLKPDAELEGTPVLFLGNGNGDGLVLEGTAEELLTYLERATNHVRLTLLRSMFGRSMADSTAALIRSKPVTITVEPPVEDWHGKARTTP